MTSVMISEITRRNIIDSLEMEKVCWNGRLNDVDFLSRIYNLKSLPSYDGRYDDAAGDIWQHCINNSDYEGYWVFSDERFNLMKCGDEEFLRFLCEMIHPLVRPDVDETEKMVGIFNDWLAEDNWKISEQKKISGRAIFFAQLNGSATKASIKRAKEASEILNSSYISQQISRLESSVELDPELAIGTSKELVETICKSILLERKANFSKGEDFPKLVKLTLKELQLVPDSIAESAKAASTIKILLNNIAAIAIGMAELRNWYGTGHGKHARSSSLKPRHARLVVGAASTLLTFLMDTYVETKVGSSAVPVKQGDDSEKS
ncbi:MAG: abortive infection family protein [Bdellovibrionia bacterium]